MTKELLKTWFWILFREGLQWMALVYHRYVQDFPTQE